MFDIGASRRCSAPLQSLSPHTSRWVQDCGTRTDYQTAADALAFATMRNALATLGRLAHTLADTGDQPLRVSETTSAIMMARDLSTWLEQHLAGRPIWPPIWDEE
jgi:hypothetical protein